MTNNTSVNVDITEFAERATKRQLSKVTKELQALTIQHKNLQEQYNKYKKNSIRLNPDEYFQLQLMVNKYSGLFEAIRNVQLNLNRAKKEKFTFIQLLDVLGNLQSAMIDITKDSNKIEKLEKILNIIVVKENRRMTK